MQPRNEKYDIYIRLRTHDRYLIHSPHGRAIVHLLSCSAACEKNNWLINVYIHYISYTHEPIHNCNITKTKQCSTTLRLYFVVYTEESWDCPFRFGRTLAAHQNVLPAQSTFPDKDAEWYSTRPDICSRPDHVTCVRNWRSLPVSHTLVETLGF